jgi:hypothetical protein
MDIKKNNAEQMFDMLKSICEAFTAGNKTLLSARLAQAILFVGELRRFDDSERQQIFQ